MSVTQNDFLVLIGLVLFVALFVAIMVLRNQAAKRDRVNHTKSDETANSVSIKPKKKTIKQL